MKMWGRFEHLPVPPRYARLVGIGFMCVTAFLWFSIEKIGTMVPPKYFPFQIVWMRYATHLALMLVFLGPSEKSRLVVTRRPTVHVVRSLLMLGMPLFFIAAVAKGLPADFVWSVNWLALPLAVGAGIFLLRERASRSQWLVLLVALAGAWLVIHPELPAIGWSWVLAFAVSGCVGFYVTLTRSLRDEPLATNLFHTALWVFVGLSLILPFWWQPMSFRVIAIMMVVGGWGFLLLLSWDRALASAPLAVVLPFLLTESLWGAAYRLWRQGITPDAWGWLGVVLVTGTCGFIVSREIALLRSSPPSGANTADEPGSRAAAPPATS